MKTQPITLCLILLFLISTKVISQSFPDNPSQIVETPASPTMWEFQKYGSYPVSMHTGVPNISIPIALAKSGVLGVPVNLSYHASGIKVDQKASWVGLGWTLNAGGAITRTIRNCLDESNHGYINYPFNASGTLDKDTDHAEIEETMAGSVDSEPDHFYYNFLGYSGKFVFNHNTNRNDATIALIPHNDLKVTWTFSGASITSFTILTPEGITAEFAYPESSNETRYNLLGSHQVNANVTWHLKKLTAPNGIDEITFEYKTINTVFDWRVSESESVNYPDPCYQGNYTVNTKINTGGLSFFNVKRLEKIIFNNGYMLFNSSSGNRDDEPQDEDLRLDNIEVYSDISGTQTLINKFEFTYDYFGTINTSNSIPDDREVRLQLEKVTEKGENGETLNPYEFTYKDSGAYNELPYRFSYEQDYWGYPNGKIGNTSLVPQYSYTARDPNSTVFNIGDADRDPDPLFTQAGMIEKITYPTKGYTLFEFESNKIRISEASGTNEYTVGGLRIENIKNYDSDGSLITERSYGYTKASNPSHSSGIYNANSFISPNDFLFIRPYYFNAALDINCNPYEGPYKTYITYNDGIQPNPTVGQDLASGFYSEVIEYNGSALDHKGYSRYYYETTKDDIHQATGPLSFALDRSWDRGQLLKKEVYENGNSSPIASVTNTYEEVQIQSPISAYKAGGRFDVQSSNFEVISPFILNWFRNEHFLLLYYDQPVIWKRLKSSVTVQDGVSTQKDYFYDSNLNHSNIVRTSTTGSDLEVLETNIYYPDDITGISFLPEGGDLTASEYTQIEYLKSDVLHLTSTPIQTVTKKDGAILSVLRYLFDTFDNITLPSIIQTSKGNDDVEDKLLFNDYEDGRPIHVSKKDGVDVSYIWGYNNTKPIAKIENVSYASISSLVSSLNLVGLSDDDDDRTIDIINTSGSITYVGKEGDLREALESFRTNAALSNAVVTTYTYDPLIGVTSITDPKGYTIYYEYDEFNRLKQVKDTDGKILSQNDYHYKDQQ